MKKLLALFGITFAVSAFAQIDWDDGSAYGTATKRKSTFSMMVLDTSVPRGSHPTQRYKLIPLHLLFDGLIRFEDNITRYVSLSSTNCNRITGEIARSGNSSQGWGTAIRLPQPPTSGTYGLVVSIPMREDDDPLPWFGFGPDSANSGLNNTSAFEKLALTFSALPMPMATTTITYEVWCLERRPPLPGYPYTVPNEEYNTYGLYFDANAQPPRQIAVFDFESTEATEGDDLVFTVELTEPTPARTESVMVSYRTEAQSGSRGASAADFTSASGTLTFVTGESSKTITVATTQDTTQEYDESVGLEFSDPVNARFPPGTFSGLVDSTSGSIIDDDRPTFTVADASGNEGDGITFTISLDKEIPGYGSEPGRTIAMSLVAYTSGEIAENLRATVGTDYERLSSSIRLSFEGTAGETKSFTVLTIEDTIDEPNEMFTLSIFSRDQVVPLSVVRGTGTIIDDD